MDITHDQVTEAIWVAFGLMCTFAVGGGVVAAFVWHALLMRPRLQQFAGVCEAAYREVR